MTLPTTLQEIYDSKKERRKILSALPVDQRVELIEKLHEFGLLMRGNRRSAERDQRKKRACC